MESSNSPPPSERTSQCRPSEMRHPSDYTTRKQSFELTTCSIPPTLAHLDGQKCLQAPASFAMLFNILRVELSKRLLSMALLSCNNYIASVPLDRFRFTITNFTCWSILPLRSPILLSESRLRLGTGPSPPPPGPPQQGSLRRREVTSQSRQRGRTRGNLATSRVHSAESE
jgi:hypothetical protein